MNHALHLLRASTVCCLFASALLVATAAPCAAQTREKKSTAKDFPALVKEATAAFEAKDNSKAIDKLRAALQIALEALEKEIIAAMPAAPDGFKARPAKKRAAGDPFAAVMIASMGSPIEHRYDGTGGQSIKITCVAKSPMVPMIAAAFTMGANDPNKELIGYGSHKGLLDKQSGGEHLQLQVVIAEKHLLTIEASGISEETLFAMIDQAFVDRLAKILD